MSFVCCLTVWSSMFCLIGCSKRRTKAGAKRKAVVFEEEKEMKQDTKQEPYVPLVQPPEEDEKDKITAALKLMHDL